MEQSLPGIDPGTSPYYGLLYTNWAIQWSDDSKNKIINYELKCNRHWSPSWGWGILSQDWMKHETIFIIRMSVIAYGDNRAECSIFKGSPWPIFCWWIPVTRLKSVQLLPHRWQMRSALIVFSLLSQNSWSERSCAVLTQLLMSLLLFATWIR